MLNKAFQAYDNIMMLGANKAFQAWNWTTGKQKKELANALAYIAPFVESSALLFYPGDMKSKLLTALYSLPVIFASAYAVKKKNDQIDTSERRSFESGCIDLDAEKTKRDYSLIGLPCVTSSGCCLALGIIHQDPSLQILGAGLSMFSSSLYIMRADNVPPRKDCIRRGIDNARKGIEDLVQTVLPRPA